ncbi:MAG: hypothetical protein Ct9H300mP1_00310 [Planctomycetaceae bacterium]|nr:MAG: hypothetical protein Ct9H300mP1_00310 [Planctomycetaceae bacterium]
MRMSRPGWWWGAIEDPPGAPPRPAARIDVSRSYQAHLLPDGQPCDFLEAIGVMTSEGRVKASRQGKFRQVNRFLELVDDCVEGLPQEGNAGGGFWCGKSYLTFAVHHL